MSLSLRRLLERLYPANGGARTVIIAGLDYSGKTTLLYLLKLGEIITTISSIGFNVETFDVLTTSKTTLKLEGWDMGTGCAGYLQIINMLRHYILRGEALIWMVDSADKDRLPESVIALEGTLRDVDLDLLDKPRHFPVLILANKSDLPKTLPLDEVRKAFSKATSGRIAAVYRTSLTQKPPSGLTEAIDWLALALDIAKSSKPSHGNLPPEVKVSLPNFREPSLLAKKLEDWLHRAEKDSVSEEFMKQFNSLSLPSWDHYTHIRLAYVILKTYGRQKGKDMIFDGLANYIANSSQTAGRAFHVTMTYFWIQIVHFGIRNMPQLSLSSVEENIPSPTSSTSDSTAPAADSRSPSLDDFSRFLLINPHICDGNLWTDYYSKDVMMSPDAKTIMVLPDKKPLPSLVARDAITTFGAK